MTRGDITAQIAYGAGWQLVATLRDNDGDLVDVTGYTARFAVLAFDDSTTWSEVLTDTVATGGALGTFTATLDSDETQGLAEHFGDPTPRRKGRLAVYATPPGGSEGTIVHGVLLLRPAGEAVDPLEVDVFEDTFSVNVSAVGTAGAAGPPGPPGPATSTDPWAGAVPLFNGEDYDPVGADQTLVTANANTTVEPIADETLTYRLQTSQLTAGRVLTIDDTDFDGLYDNGIDTRVSVHVVKSESGFSWTIHDRSGATIFVCPTGRHCYLDLVFDGVTLVKAGVSYKW